MGKEFIPYTSENGRMPVSGRAICENLTKYAKEYIKENRDAIKGMDPNLRDAILVDAINYLGTPVGGDYGLYTKDLYDGREDFELADPQLLITAIINHCSIYIFNYGMVNSVLRNSHMNNWKESFQIEDGANLLTDFINYILEKNNYDRIITKLELYEKAEKNKLACDMQKLKEFLLKSDRYTKRLVDGESVEEIFNSIAKKHGFEYISTRGRYHSLNSFNQRTNKGLMYNSEKLDFERELYALSYAYSILNPSVSTSNQIMDKMIREMKKR